MLATLPFLYVFLLTNLRRAILEWLTPMRSSRSGLVMDVLRTRAELIGENALLRQQVIILKRSVKRPQVHKSDKLLLLALASKLCRWQQALLVIQPSTLLRWHRDLFRWLWKVKSTSTKRGPKLSTDLIHLIRRMARENSLWGAERLRGELLKLGLRVSKRTIQRYMRWVRGTRPRGQTWATFLRNHAATIWACDFVQTYDIFFRTIFIFVVVEHASRRVVHYGVTRYPSDQWVAQQLKEATPFGVAPAYLIRDNDRKYGQRFSLIAKSCGIEEVRIPYHSPNLNAIAERFIGSLRRECLDHLLIWNEDHLRKITKDYVAYFNQARPHQGLAQKIPNLPLERLELTSSSGCNVVAIPVLGGLHHRYERAA